LPEASMQLQQCHAGLGTHPVQHLAYLTSFRAAPGICRACLKGDLAQSIWSRRAKPAIGSKECGCPTRLLHHFHHLKVPVWCPASGVVAYQQLRQCSQLYHLEPEAVALSAGKVLLCAGQPDDATAGLTSTERNMHICIGASPPSVTCCHMH
jgi:hypothetical protein